MIADLVWAFRHHRTAGHWPKIVAYDAGMRICEWCIKPPSRPMRRGLAISFQGVPL